MAPWGPYQPPAPYPPVAVPSQPARAHPVLVVVAVLVAAATGLLGFAAGWAEQPEPAFALGYAVPGVVLPLIVAGIVAAKARCLSRAAAITFIVVCLGLFFVRVLGTAASSVS